MSRRDAFFKSRLKRSDSTAGSCNESGSEFQTVGPATEKPAGAKCECDETAEYSVCDGWPEMLAAGNFGDWHATDGEVPRALY